MEKISYAQLSKKIMENGKNLGILGGMVYVVNWGPNGGREIIVRSKERGVKGKIESWIKENYRNSRGKEFQTLIFEGWNGKEVLSEHDWYREGVKYIWGVSL